MIESKQIKVLTGHSNVIMSIMSLDDNNNLVSADDRGEIIIWDVLEETLIFRFSYDNIKLVNTCLSLYNKSFMSG